MWQSLEVLNVFNTFNFETQTIFRKLRYRFLVESTEIENATFLYKAALSKANDNTNRLESTKCTYHKEQIFASTYFIFSKILFQFMNLA